MVGGGGRWWWLRVRLIMDWCDEDYSRLWRPVR